MVSSEAVWDGVADKYAKTPIPDEGAYAYTLERVRAHLKPGDRVLEIGCGTGSTALQLADAAAHVTASDISGEMVRIGEEKAKAAGIGNVRFVRGVPGDAALAEGGPYDVVMAFNLLHLVEDLPGMLDEVHKLVKPGGLFISKTFCRAERGGGFKYHAMRVALPVMQLFGKAPFVAFMPVPEFEGKVAKAGFEFLETGSYPKSPPRRFIVGRRR